MENAEEQLRKKKAKYATEENVEKHKIWEKSEHKCEIFKRFREFLFSLAPRLPTHYQYLIYLFHQWKLLSYGIYEKKSMLRSSVAGNKQSEFFCYSVKKAIWVT